jgi:hypothetical protein
MLNRELDLVFSNPKAKTRHRVPDPRDRSRVEVWPQEGFMAARVLCDSTGSSDCWLHGISAREGKMNSHLIVQLSC